MAEDYDLAAKECYSRLGSGLLCAQEAASSWNTPAATAKKAPAPSSCKLPEARNASNIYEAEAMEGEFMAYSLCTMWEKFKSLIGG